MGLTSVAVCGVVPVAANIVPVLSAAAYRTGTISRATTTAGNIMIYTYIQTTVVETATAHYILPLCYILSRISDHLRKYRRMPGLGIPLLIDCHRTFDFINSLALSRTFIDARKTQQSAARYSTIYTLVYGTYRSPRWTSGSSPPMPLLIVLVREFESRRGEILNLFAKKKKERSTAESA